MENSTLKSSQPSRDSGKGLGKRLAKRLARSPISYFSDLFIMAMVLAWIAVIVIMIVMAVYATIRLADTSVWSYLGELVAIPLTAGGAIWLVKCGVQHAIANQRGERAHEDFPAVYADGQDDGAESVMGAGQDSLGASAGDVGDTGELG